MDSGFVTYRKGKGDNCPLLDDSDCDDDNNAAYISVYQTKVESWRKLLKVGNTNKLLVAFAWCHDDELQNARQFPEFWACDATFGVTKEQRNLFLIASIDGNNKVLTIFRYQKRLVPIIRYLWITKVII